MAFEDVEYRSTEQRDGRADQPQRHGEIARELGAEAAGDNQHRQLRRHGVDRGRGQRKHRKLALLLPEIDKHRASRAYGRQARSEEHTSELQQLMRISYGVFCLKNKTTTYN